MVRKVSLFMIAVALGLLVYIFILLSDLEGTIEDKPEDRYSRNFFRSVNLGQVESQ